jgi:guanine deaminase
MKTKEEFMREAIRLSELNVATGKGGPFGAIVVKDGRIIARGTNQVTATHDPTAHAEIIAIRNACRELESFQLEGCELYTSCEPCPMCLGAIYWARPSKVYFANTQSDAAAIGFDDRFIYQELALPHADRKLPQEQLLAEEARQAFIEWQKAENKSLY